jgi:hypothetical protein
LSLDQPGCQRLGKPEETAKLGLKSRVCSIRDITIPLRMVAIWPVSLLCDWVACSAQIAQTITLRLNNRAVEPEPHRPKV